jgi:hypothetical protein
MDDKERVELIRKGNELFNKGKINESAKIFLQTDYRDGLIRVGDYYYYQEKNILKAFIYYKRAGYKKRLEELYDKMAKIVHFLLQEDEISTSNDTNDKEKDKGSTPLVKKYEFPKIK